MKQNKTIKNETQQRYMHQKGKMHPTKPRERWPLLAFEQQIC